MDKEPLTPAQSQQEAITSLRERLVSRIPGQLQDKLREGMAQLDAHMPTLHSNAKTGMEAAREFLAPLWAELRGILRNTQRKIVASSHSATIGGTFRHLCFVGLNRAELLIAGENQSIFNDNWTDLVGDNIKRHTALAFFAPRGLDGKPVNPYLFLLGESIPDEEEVADPNAIALAEQTVGAMPLLDLCRLSPAPPNTVNMLLVADTLFHWDVKDNYVFPTTPTGWVRDVEQVMKSYPRTTRFNLYTQWDADLLPPSDRLTIHRLREFPLDDATWLNEPTLQERYGTHMLLLGLVTAALVYAGLWYQGSQLTALTDQLNVIEQQIPRGGQFNDLERAIAEQEKMWERRELFGLVVKDSARAIQNSNFKALSFEVRVTEPERPPTAYVVNIDAKADAYQGWLQQEPAARSLILNSAVLDAIRKPPTPSGFKLEALVDAAMLSRAFKTYAPQMRPVPPSPTAPEPQNQEAASPQAFTVQPPQRNLEPSVGNPTPYLGRGGEGE